MHELFLFLYGPAKIGKTEWAAQWDGIHFISTEPGLKFQKVSYLDVGGKPILSSWENFKSIISFLSNNPDELAKVSTLCIDTVDNLYFLMFDHVCKEGGFDYPGEGNYGKDWAKVRKEWCTGLASLVALNTGVLFIGHSKEREIDVIERGIQCKRLKYVPTLTPSTFDTINALCDFNISVQIREQRRRRSKGENDAVKDNRVMTVQTNTDSYTGGNRLKGFPSELPFTYGAFCDAFEETKERIG